MKLPILLLALAALSSGERVSYSGHRVLRALIPDAASGAAVRSALDSLGLEPQNMPRVGTFADVLVRSGSEEEREFRRVLSAAGVEVETAVEDLGKAHEEEQRLIAQRRQEFAALREKSGSDRDSDDFDLFNYQDLATIYQYMNDLAAEFPDLCSVDTIGTSFEGRDIRILKICEGGCGDRKIMYVDAGIHSREWIGPASVAYMVDRLVKGEGDDDLTEKMDWYFVFVVNPDGYDFTWTEDRQWRKTRKTFDDSICIGVDANRNFGYEWGGEGASNVTCSDSYDGPEPFSESETQAIRDLLLGLGDQVAFYQNTHSYSQLIMYPWGYTEDLPEDADDQDNLATIGNQALFDENGVVYQVGPVYTTIYPASGLAVDWAYGGAGVKYSYTIEARPATFVGGGFELPPEEIEPTGRELYAFHAAAARVIIEELGL